MSRAGVDDVTVCLVNSSQDLGEFKFYWNRTSGKGALTLKASVLCMKIDPGCLNMITTHPAFIPIQLDSGYTASYLLTDSSACDEAQSLVRNPHQLPVFNDVPSEMVPDTTLQANASAPAKPSYRWSHNRNVHSPGHFGVAFDWTRRRRISMWEVKEGEGSSPMTSW